MTNRVTKRDLTNVLNRINAAAGQNPEPWTRGRCENGKWTANVGTYTLDWAYGGVRLVQIVTEGGGERDITPRGTKRECLQMMRAFEAGLEARS